jgi:hypothetical protein
LAHFLAFGTIIVPNAMAFGTISMAYGTMAFGTMAFGTILWHLAQYCGIWHNIVAYGTWHLAQWHLAQYCGIWHNSLRHMANGTISMAFGTILYEMAFGAIYCRKLYLVEKIFIETINA